MKLGKGRLVEQRVQEGLAAAGLPDTEQRVQEGFAAAGLPDTEPFKSASLFLHPDPLYSKDDILQYTVHTLLRKCI